MTNDFLDFAEWAIYVAFLLRAAAAISRRVNRHYAKPGEGR